MKAELKKIVKYLKSQAGDYDPESMTSIIITSDGAVIFRPATFEAKANHLRSDYMTIDQFVKRVKKGE
jgi:hypothetical protein